MSATPSTPSPEERAAKRDKERDDLRSFLVERRRLAKVRTEEIASEWAVEDSAMVRKISEKESAQGLDLHEDGEAKPVGHEVHGDNNRTSLAYLQGVSHTQHPAPPHPRALPPKSSSPQLPLPTTPPPAIPASPRTPTSPMSPSTFIFSQLAPANGSPPTKVEFLDEEFMELGGIGPPPGSLLPALPPTTPYSHSSSKATPSSSPILVIPSTPESSATKSFDPQTPPSEPLPALPRHSSPYASGSNSPNTPRRSSGLSTYSTSTLSSLSSPIVRRNLTFTEGDPSSERRPKHSDKVNSSDSEDGVVDFSILLSQPLPKRRISRRASLAPYSPGSPTPPQSPRTFRSTPSPNSRKNALSPPPLLRTSTNGSVTPQIVEEGYESPESEIDIEASLETLAWRAGVMSKTLGGAGDSDSENEMSLHLNKQTIRKSSLPSSDSSSESAFDRSFGGEVRSTSQTGSRASLSPFGHSRVSTASSRSNGPNSPPRSTFAGKLPVMASSGQNSTLVKSGELVPKPSPTPSTTSSTRTIPLKKSIPALRRPSSNGISLSSSNSSKLSPTPSTAPSLPIPRSAGLKKPSATITPKNAENSATPSPIPSIPKLSKAVVKSLAVGTPAKVASTVGSLKVPTSKPVSPTPAAGRIPTASRIGIPSKIGIPKRVVSESK